MVTIDVRETGVGEHRLVGEIIGEGFHDDPVNLWAFNGPKPIIPSMTELARTVYLPRGFSHVTTDEGGATLWLPPGVSPDLPIYKMLGLAWPILRYGGLTAMGRGLRLSDFMAKNHPHEPHYYLFAIAVRPDRQGQGLGGKLMREGLKRADADGVGAYLENTKERNLPIYRSFGFELLEKVTPVDGAPPMWRMFRPAADRP